MGRQKIEDVCILHHFRFFLMMKGWDRSSVAEGRKFWSLVMQSDTKIFAVSENFPGNCGTPRSAPIAKMAAMGGTSALARKIHIN